MDHPTIIRLTAGEDGQEIRIEQEDTLLVVLESNPSTGYQWEVTEIDPSILELTDDTYHPDADSAMGVGAAGTQRLTFKPAGEGRTHLALAYRRSWETEVEPADTFAVDIKVKPTPPA
jgi:inhibitor of cysteine peptidase